MDEDAWPRAESINPFLPLALQRRCGIPQASPDQALAYARRITESLLHTAEEVIVSYGGTSGERRLEASPLVAGLPPSEWKPEPARIWPSVDFEIIADTQGPALPEGQRHAGGTRALQFQSACPFRAFAEIRLAARPLEAPPLGLDARERGTLLHAALRLCWEELRTQQRLLTFSEEELASLVSRSVDAAIRNEDGPPISQFHERIQQVERARLTALLTRWLELERERPTPFTVLPPESPRDLHVGGLIFRARVDRMDQFPDGRVAIIDYKSTAPSAAAWDGDRPEEPQVPLYATSLDVPLAAVAFAQVQTGDSYFRGLGADPLALPGVKAVDLEQTVERWRAALTRLAIEFREGRAAVDPRNPGACTYCHLHALCRIDETP
jgi:probable DNA repair protein